MRFTIPGARALVPMALAATLLISAAPSRPAAAASLTEAQQVIQIANAQIGDPWRYGATGPSAFDCSGLVIYAYKSAGDLGLIGNGTYRSAAAIYKYFRDRGRTSRTTATPGDLVIWGNGGHIGIYLGGGMAVSALSSGVRVHGVFAVAAPFTAYLRTGIYQMKPPTAPIAPAPVSTTAPKPIPTPIPVGAVAINRKRTGRRSPGERGALAWRTCPSPIAEALTVRSHRASIAEMDSGRTDRRPSLV